MTPHERERLARQFNYREPVTWEDFPLHGPMLAIPVACFASGVNAIANHNAVIGVGLLLFGALVAAWAVAHYRRPARPDNNEDFDRELRHRIAEEQGRQTG